MPTKTRGVKLNPIIITGIIVIGVLLVLVLMVIAGENATNKLKAQTGFSLACPAKTIDRPWTTTSSSPEIVKSITADMAKSSAINKAYIKLVSAYNSTAGRNACKGTIGRTPALNCAPPVGCGEMGEPRGSKKSANKNNCTGSAVPEKNYQGNKTGMWLGTATCTGFCEWRQGCKELFPSSPAPR